MGGATISTPGIRALGVSPLIAIGTTLPSILPSAISGGLRYHREGLVDWTAVGLTAPVGMLAAVGGALLSGVVPGGGHVLQVATAGLLGLSAWRTGRGAGWGVGDSEGGDGGTGGGGRRSPARFAGVGLAAGGLSGLLGIGGGIVLVPGLHQVAGLSVRASVATSLVSVGALAVPGTIAHSALGNVDWRVALLLAVTVVPGARIGAAASLRLRDRRLAQVVAAFLGLIAVVYAAGELSALTRR